MHHHTKLDKIYKQESNTDVKERIQLVRRIVQDKQHIEDVAKELHRCRESMGLQMVQKIQWKGIRWIER